MVNNNRIKFKVSLTKRRTELLRYATDTIKDYHQIKFAFADTNGQLKIRLNYGTENNRLVNNFNSEHDLHEIVTMLGLPPPPEELFERRMGFDKFLRMNSLMNSRQLSIYIYIS